MALNTEKYYDRDLSWLRFNHRVLQEVADKRNPLYERVKFIAIFGSNLDEFFKVRVSSIRQIKSLDKEIRKKLITKPNKILKVIKEEVDRLLAELETILNESLVPDLEAEGVYFVNNKQYNKQQKAYVEEYFATNIASKLSMHVRDIPNAKNLDVENEQLYLTTLTEKEELIWFKIPLELPRTIVFPSSNNTYQLTTTDDIIKHVCSLHYESTFYSLRVSRDAELYIDNEYSGNLLEKLENSLQNRDTGQITRVLLDGEMPKTLTEKLKSFLDINDVDIIYGGTHHNLKSFFQLPNPTQKKLTFEDLPPKKQQELSAFDTMFDAIKQKDRILHYPYESFEPVLRFIQEAAHDDKVKKMKVTLYRVSKDSAVANALLEALKNGKNVCVFIETKARFDEENNIHWGKILKENGANVIFSYPGIKVHSKILYVERLEDEEIKSYTYISTGNFNERTAKIYTDLGLFTANPEITFEILQVFQVLQRKIIIPNPNHLLVSPFNSRTRFVEMIKKEIKHAKAGKEAYIILKMNSLQDTNMIDLLYKASNAGVKVRIIVRGICCLVPGIEYQSENIEVTSIIDRFLEHSRVFIFANGGKEKMYIGSADWMTRNLDHRIEVITPILDEEVFNRIKAVIQLQLDDKVKARIIDAKQENKYISKLSNGEGSQNLTYNLF